LAWAKYHISVTSNGLAVPDDYWPLANLANVPNEGEVANAKIRRVCLKLEAGNRVVPAAALYATKKITAGSVSQTHTCTHTYCAAAHPHA
jgi:hypothetical protein